MLGEGLVFAFDPEKSRENARKQGVSFADAEGVFRDVLAFHRMDPDASGEARCLALGMGSAGRLLVVVYVMRGDDVRLISARRATRREVKCYEA